MRFQLVDRILEVEPGRRICLVKHLTLGEEYLADHFPTFPVMPGVLMLQTLVENSVKYAVSPRREGGTICVTGFATDGRIRVTVEDDGPGFDAAHRPDGHGLALLDARLAMLFGDRASMRVESRPGRTAVTLDVPDEVRLTPDTTGTNTSG